LNGFVAAGVADIKGLGLDCDANGFTAGWTLVGANGVFDAGDDCPNGAEEKGLACGSWDAGKEFDIGCEGCPNEPVAFVGAAKGFGFRPKAEG